MYHKRKIKPDRSITGLLPAIIAISLFIITNIFWGVDIGLKVLGVTILIYSIFTFIAVYRTRSIGYFFSALYLLSMGLYLLIVPAEFVFESGHDFPPMAKFFVFTSVFLLLVLIYLMATRKIKWKGREVFELAARLVNESPGSFTERPRPVAKIKYSKDELLGFAGFMRRNLIALPYYETNRIVLAPVPMKKDFAFLYKYGRNYIDKSWVAFDFDGNVSVHISKEDYLNYKDELSFDQLCTSMANLFIEFLEYFVKGEEVRIIDKLDSLKMNIFT